MVGREATIQCRWGDDSGLCKVLMESIELLVRGSFRRRAPISSLTDISVVGDDLRFRVGQEDVCLALGSKLAEKWAAAIKAPPPSLAKKLGISSATRLRVIGSLESEELTAAIAEAGEVGDKEATLIVASVNSVAELDRAVDRISALNSPLPPVWVVYPKGKAGEVGESLVRERLLGRGFVDAKVASVSASHTALRFVKRAQ